jgi:hypothetical protein
VDPKERIVRELYEARSRRDWGAVLPLLAETVIWHEPGEDDHSGDYRGRDDVVALFEKLVAVTEGTFQLEPEGFLNSEDHSVALIRWWAERGGVRSEGNDIAVYRFQGNEIVEVWFHTDGYEQDPFSAVFAY